MTSTPTPEPGERVWRCLLDGSCTATSTDDIGYHVACGWIYFPAPSTPGEGAGRPLPEFQMVACADHMLTGHRWRCRACRREVERQFQECCEEMWRLQRTTPAPPASPVPPTRPGADAVIRALIAACPSYGRGEGDTFRIEESAVVRLAREFLAAAPPTRPAITDDLLRQAETHHGDSCSYCNSAGDIDCPTAAILDALAARPAPAVPGDGERRWVCAAPENVSPCTADDPHEWRGVDRCMYLPAPPAPVGDGRWSAKTGPSGRAGFRCIVFSHRDDDGTVRTVHPEAMDADQAEALAAAVNAARPAPTGDAERRRWCEIDGPHDSHPSTWGGDICPGTGEPG